jgi:uridine kinase
MTLRSVLEAHSARYPLARPQDLVKLLYQNEFGGGHLVDDPAASLARLRGEAALFPFTPDLPLGEDIGNDLVRVPLAAAGGGRYPLEELNDDFVRSAQLHTGSQDAFRDKLALLRAMAREGALPFSAQELEDYLADYLAQGCPAVSHSPEYRAAYRPAYRVVVRPASFRLFLDELTHLRRVPGPAVAAIDGRCASGKTTLAAWLSHRTGCPVIHMDDFFLRPEQRTPDRYETPGGNIDHERFLDQVLLPLRAGKPVAYRPFDCRTQQLGDPIQVPSAPVVLVEGSYACHPALWERYDLRVFLTVDPEEQGRRILARNGSACFQTFRERWIPLEENYFHRCFIESRCHYRLDHIPI